MTKRLIRCDEFGLYVKTGGYVFRPVDVAVREFFPSDSLYKAAAGALTKNASPSSLVPGSKVNAEHVGGSTTAKVNKELWVSASNDPRYMEYVV